MKTSIWTFVFLLIGMPCFSQTASETQFNFVSDRTVPIYSVDQVNLNSLVGKENLKDAKLEVMNGGLIRVVDHIAVLHLLGYTPLTTKLPPGIHRLQAGYGDSEKPFYFDVNSNGKRQTWRIHKYNEIAGFASGGLALAGIIGLCVSLQPASDELYRNSFGAASITLCGSAGALILAMIISPLANPTATLER